MGSSYTLGDLTVIVPELSGFRTMGPYIRKNLWVSNNDKKIATNASLTIVAP